MYPKNEHAIIRTYGRIKIVEETIMSLFQYELEPHSDIAFVDMKSFYASVECIERGLHPLQASLCVMSRAENSEGLILASSPMFKKIFGKSNVSRAYDLPFDVRTRKFSYANAKKIGLPTDSQYVRWIEEWAAKTWIVPPRMDEYIRVNLDIQKIFQQFAGPEDIYPYSIDEGFLDLTTSLNYFIADASATRKEKLDILSAKIQQEVLEQTGIYSTVGMSNANPLLAKLALDNEAKHTKTMRANWSYEDVPTKVWTIPNMTDFWGIGSRMEKRLKQLGIHSIKELAMANPDVLHQSLGIIGVELWFHSNGIDESNVHHPYVSKSQSIGNSQVLPRDYHTQPEMEVILMEMAEQVAVRLRRSQKQATVVSIHVSYSSKEEKKSIQAQQKINPTNQTKTLTAAVLQLFRKKYDGGSIRTVAVSYGGLVDGQLRWVSLFDDVDQVEKEEKLQSAIDEVREKYGFTSVLKANSLLEASRVKERSRLIGGHSAGGLEGLM